MIERPPLAALRHVSSALDREGRTFAVVIDLYARRVVGRSMQDHMRTELVLSALTMAVGQRLPEPGLIAHSDRGAQYTSDDYRRALRAHGITCSMSHRGDRFDNAVVESFFGTLKSEILYRRSWATRDEAAAAIHEYIEVFYNRRRRHSFLGHRTPAEHEDLAVSPSTQAAERTCPPKRVTIRLPADTQEGKTF